MMTENEALYNRLRNHPAIKKLINDCGASGGQDYFLIMKKIDEIDSYLSQGKNHDDVYKTIIFSDENDYSLAFLLHVEGTFNTTITSPIQLKNLVQIKHKRPDTKYRDQNKTSSQPVPGDLDDDIQNCFYQAQECKYLIVLERLLRDGGKHKDLLNTNPTHYGLPQTWNSHNEVMNKERMILKAISLHIKWLKFEGIDQFDPKPFNLKDFAKEIEAPLALVQKASKYYD